MTFGWKQNLLRAALLKCFRQLIWMHHPGRNSPGAGSTMSLSWLGDASGFPQRAGGAVWGEGSLAENVGPVTWCCTSRRRWVCYEHQSLLFSSGNNPCSYESKACIPTFKHFSVCEQLIFSWDFNWYTKLNWCVNVIKRKLVYNYNCWVVLQIKPDNCMPLFSFDISKRMQLKNLQRSPN